MKTIHNKKEYIEYLYTLEDYFEHCIDDQDVLQYEKFKWNLYSTADADDVDIRKFFDIDILDKMKSLLHSKVKDTADKKHYTVLGLQITDDDYYWILEDENRYITYASCITPLEKIQ